MTDVQKALSYAEGFLTALAAVLQDREWVDGKVGNITLTTAEVKKLLRDVATHTGCDENELMGLREDNEAMKEQVHNLLEYMKEYRKEKREALESVTAEAKKVNPVPLVVPCDAWHKQGDRAECWAVKERSLCTCGGDKDKCDFYGG